MSPSSASSKLSLSSVLLAAFALATSPSGAAQSAGAESRQQVSSLEITILSTMLADRGVGEWGFAALVEADGHRILFDTGMRPDTVTTNAKTLGVDLASVKEVVLSHHHGDHTGGLISLRREYAKANPEALSVAHVGRGIFWKRQLAGASMGSVQYAYEALGGNFVEHDAAVQIHPGIWLTGPVPRVHAERNWGNPATGTAGRVESPEGPVEDDIPESLSLVIDTPKGLVVVSGCGHAGMVNIVEHARRSVREAPIHAAIGGFHLLHASDETLRWTAGKLAEARLENLIGAHCTGLEPVYLFRELLGLRREHAVVGAVGGTFSLARGIEPGVLAR
ncbi:MAG: MBL fold metallo-hydrolase [Acidobacteria bacterium]|nr:MAG: MBL fold metallo-hydrolase [Acidobacteriota bacterium]REK09327.1 MAG: MBL fold metallo-hydrolase [Acidobacteriota bacterium]